MADITIRLIYPEKALIKDVRFSVEEDYRSVPFTHSPLDSCRGGFRRKNRSLVRDAQKSQDTQKIQGGSRKSSTGKTE